MQNNIKIVDILVTMCYYNVKKQIKVNNMTFGQKVKRMRYALNLSQKMLADELHVAFATINRWEKMHTEPNFVSKQKIVAFCKANNISFD